MAFKIVDSYQKHGFACKTVEVILDSAADLSSVGTEDEYGNMYAPGSTALDVSTGTIYIINASRQWVKFGG